MKYIISHHHNPYENLALEEVLFRESKEPLLYLWQNDHTIVVGKNQNTFEEINAEEVAKRKISVVRRETGGGAVYHDLGNLNFSLIVTIKENEIYEYASFLTPVIRALSSFGVHASLQGRNDLLVDGYKISGNAQIISGNRVLHHGTILVNSDLSVLSKVLNVSPSKLKSKGIKSLQSRVANISSLAHTTIPIDLLEQKIIEECCGAHPEALSLPEGLREKITRLAHDKYASYDWNYGSSPKSQFVNEKKFACGTIKVLLDIEKGLICSCQFYGDFLDTRDIQEIAQALVGTPYQQHAVVATLEQLHFDRYLKGITQSECISLFFS